MKANEYLIYCDMDGTMLSDWSLGPVVPKTNLMALKEFIRMGGAVSIATGRQYTNTLIYFENILFPAPLVTGNGSSLFDQHTNRVVSREILPDICISEAIDLVKKHDNLWLVTADEAVMYHLSESSEKDARIDNTFPRVKRTEQELYSMEFTKLCYICADPSLMPELWGYVRQMQSFQMITAAQSAPIYLEVVKKGVSKAYGIQKAMRIAGYQNRRLVCFGDYLNDYEMLKMADIAACPENAAPEIKEIADIITCHHNDGAFADLLRKLP